MFVHLGQGKLAVDLIRAKRDGAGIMALKAAQGDKDRDLRKNATDGLAELGQVPALTTSDSEVAR